MEKEVFKEKFPDVKKQVIQTFSILSRADKEKMVTKIATALNTAVIHYESHARTLQIFTSDMLKKDLESMQEGDTIINPSSKEAGQVLSQPFFVSGDSCLRVQFGKYAASYSIDTLIDR